MFDPTIFRTSAIQHYLTRDREGTPVPLRIAPAWTWWLFWVLASAMALALGLSMVLKVEVQSTGRGVFQVAGGARSLVSQIPGQVVRVAAAPGQRVQPGDLILELESASIRSQLLEADRALAQLDQVTRPAQAGLDHLAEAQIQEALRRRDAQIAQLASQERSVQLFERKLVAAENLERHGLVSTMMVEDAREALAQATRSVNSARQALMSSEQEVASLRARRGTDSLRNIQEIQALRTRRDALAFSLTQTRIHAADRGAIEGLYVRAGDVVSVGQNLGRLLVGGGEQPKAFAMLAERDRAQVNPGDGVRLEVDQYPYAEWGKLDAVIRRISENPATPSEIREIFGEQAKADVPSYLVELAIPTGQDRPVARHSFQSGMNFQARFVLRRQRPITFLLEPLRRWLG